MKNLQTITGRLLINSRSRFIITAFGGIIAFGALIFILFGGGAVGILKAQAAPEQQSNLTGEWTAEFDRNKPGRIQMTFHRRSEKFGFNMSSDSVSLSELQGLTTEIAFSPKTSVNFNLVRQAGTFACEGYFNDGRGAGFWTFTASKSFISEMSSRGYNNLTEEELLRAGWSNLTTKFIDDLKSEGYDHLKYEEIVRASNHDITLEFIREMRSGGYDKLTMENLIRARNHDINAEYVKEVRAMGFDKQPLESLIRFKNHDITQEFINSMSSVGFTNLTLEDLIRLKSRDITPEFVKGIKAEGFSDLTAETVIRLKSREIDQDFIKQAKAKGLTNLTLDQLIRLRAQDIVK